MGRVIATDFGSEVEAMSRNIFRESQVLQVRKSIYIHLNPVRRHALRGILVIGTNSSECC